MRKEGDLPSDVLSIIAKLEAQADARMEEMENKRMRLEAEIEEKRREQERKHEERMQTMLFGFMQQIMAGFGSVPPPQSPGQPYPHINYTPYTLHSHLNTSFSHPSFPSSSSSPPISSSPSSLFPPGYCPDDSDED